MIGDLLLRIRTALVAFAAASFAAVGTWYWLFRYLMK